MVWNSPGNKGQDPWNKENNGRQNKGFDPQEIFNKFGTGPKKTIVIGIIFAILGLWVISGFYTVQEAYRSVVLRFGSFNHVDGPGLQWKATFIDSITLVDVKSVRSIPTKGRMLTEDENLVQVEMDVQYTVVDPYKYLYSTTEANDSLREAVDSALRYVVGHNSMDNILTTGREEIRQSTRSDLERIIEPYNLGIQIEDVNFLPARPPDEVKPAFDDAIAAQEDEQRFIREAEAYVKKVEPEAGAMVNAITKKADAYKKNVILIAQGDADKFNLLLPEYVKHPDVTRSRLYLDAMQEVLSNTNKVLANSKSGNITYLPLDRMLNNDDTKIPASNDNKSLTNKSTNSSNIVQRNDNYAPVNTSSFSQPVRPTRTGRD